MIQVKALRCRGWIDPQYSHVLCAQLTSALLERCANHVGRFITLTYNREGYADARDLYQRSREERHVREFMRRLQSYLGKSIKGKWLCKLEFQTGGWVHWHILLLGSRFIPQNDMTELWGHGHTYIKPMNDENIQYVCKYVAKDGVVPHWLLLEPARSFKVVRSSPGFWGRPPKPSSDSKEPPLNKLPVCVPLGSLIERARTHVTIRDDRNHFAQYKINLYDFVEYCQSQGAKLTGTSKNWIILDGITFDQVRKWADAKRLCRERRTLHLNTVGNPHMEPYTVSQWIDEYQRGEIAAQEYPELEKYCY